MQGGSRRLPQAILRLSPHISVRSFRRILLLLESAQINFSFFSPSLTSFWQDYSTSYKALSSVNWLNQRAIGQANRMLVLFATWHFSASFLLSEPMRWSRFAARLSRVLFLWLDERRFCWFDFHFLYPCGFEL